MTQCRRVSAWRQGSSRRTLPTSSTSAGSLASCRGASTTALWTKPAAFYI